jgi:ubiquinone biosynthesis protein UbiJ
MNTQATGFEAVPERVLAFLDRAVDRLLEFDPETRAALERLAGQVIAIEFEGIERTLYLVPGAHGVHFRARCEGEARVRVRGRPADYATLARCRLQGVPIPAGCIEIVGDLGAAQQVQAIIGGLDIDWEEMLARACGDIAGHQLARAARGAWRWFGRMREDLAANLSEYARYETEVVPERVHVDRFNAEVDDLRDAAERLEARIARLRQGAGGAQPA